MLQLRWLHWTFILSLGEILLQDRMEKMKFPPSSSKSNDIIHMWQNVFLKSMSCIKAYIRD